MLRILCYMSVFVLPAQLVSAEALSLEEAKQLMALMLNLNGHLCAEVLEVRPLKVADQYEVHCVAYRGGSGQKTYVMNLKTGAAFEQ